MSDTTTSPSVEFNERYQSYDVLVDGRMVFSSQVEDEALAAVEGRRPSMIVPPGAEPGADLGRSSTRLPSELDGRTATETGADQPERLGSARFPSERLEN